MISCWTVYLMRILSSCLLPLLHKLSQPVHLAPELRINNSCAQTSKSFKRKMRNYFLFLSQTVKRAVSHRFWLESLKS